MRVVTGDRRFWISAKDSVNKIFFFKGLDVVFEKMKLRGESSQELEYSVGHLRYNSVL